MPNKIKILIADDHQLILDGLKLMLGGQSDFEVVGTVHNGLEAINTIRERHIDVLVMDLNMPEMNGLEACRIIRKEFPGLKILILSMLADAKLIKNVLKEGATGYMLKNSGQDELSEAIRNVSQGKVHYDERVMELMLETKKTKAQNSTEMIPSLSRREKEILQLVIDEMTTPEIAAKLFIGIGTVESHRRNMISKLGVRNTAGLVSKAYQYGILD